MSRKDVKDKRRVQLIEANMTSIAKRGFAETTIAHVAEAAGMSRGIVNFYFTSKDNMMKETLAHLVEQCQAIWRARAEDASLSAYDRLLAVAAAAVDQQTLNRKKTGIWMAFLGEARSNKAFMEILAQEEKDTIRLLESLAGAAAKEKEITLDVQAFALELMMLIRGGWQHFYFLPEAETRGRVLEAVQSYVARSMNASASEHGENVIPLESKRAKKAEEKAAHPGPEHAPEQYYGDLFSA